MKWILIDFQINSIDFQLILMGSWADVQTGRWAYEQIGRWADGHMGRWADGQMGRWAGGQWIVIDFLKSLLDFQLMGIDF